MPFSTVKPSRSAFNLWHSSDESLRVSICAIVYMKISLVWWDSQLSPISISLPCQKAAMIILFWILHFWLLWNSHPFYTQDMPLWQRKKVSSGFRVICTQLYFFAVSVSSIVNIQHFSNRFLLPFPFQLNITIEKSNIDQCLYFLLFYENLWIHVS